MRFLILIGLCFGFAFCADISLSQSDFVERLINFIIFFAILWYFGSEKVKSVFTQRSQEIAISFSELQEQCRALEKEKEIVLKQLGEAEVRASEIIALAKREAMIIAQQYKDKVDRDIQSISTSFEQVLVQEQRQMLQKEIQKILNQASQDISAQGDLDFYLRVLSRRVE